MLIVTNVILPILTALAIMATLYFGIHAFWVKSRGSKAAYGFAQQEARINTQIDLIRAFFFLIVSLILLGVTGLNFEPTTAAVIDVPTAIATTTPTNTPLATATLTILQPVETAVSAPATATTNAVDSLPSSPTPVVVGDTPTPVPVDTPVPAQTVTAQTATVSSGVGVWLRSAPTVSSEQVEWLLEGDVVTVLAGQGSADEFEWQQVRTVEGNEGWVAVPFIQYNVTEGG